MAGRDVADVRREAVVRIEGVQATHGPVANDLRDDRCGGDCGASLVAVHDRLVLGRQRSEPKTVYKAGLSGRAEGGERLTEPPQVRLVQPVAVDRPGGDDADRDSCRAARDGAEEHLTALFGHLLRVVQEGEWANAVVAQLLVVEENTRDDQRPGEAPATGLIRTRNEPRTEASVESEQLLAGSAHHPRIDVVVGQLAYVTLMARFRIRTVTVSLRRARPGAARGLM